MTEKTKAKVDEEFSEENIPRDNWIKFPDVGNWFVGTFIKREPRAAEGKFGPQMVYTICNVKYNGEQKPINEEWLMGMAIREGKANFINNRLQKLVPGMRFGIKFMEELPPPEKGLNKIKSYMPNIFEMDPEYVSVEDEFGASKPEDEEIDVNKVPM